jgi:hypothetical protein
MPDFEQQIVRSGTWRSREASPVAVHVIRHCPAGQTERTPVSGESVTFYVLFGDLPEQPPYPTPFPGFLTMEDAVHHAQEHVPTPIEWDP